MSQVPEQPDMERHEEGPSDGTTLAEVLHHYSEAGFTSGFTAEADGFLRCSSCDAVVDAATVAMHCLRRLEGASDPSEMMAVVALTCPACGQKGTTALTYGSMASAEDADVLTRLRDQRHDDVGPASAAPGEAAGHPDR